MSERNTHGLLGGILHTSNSSKKILITEQAYKDSSGIHKLKCNTCNGAYVGQSGRAINVRYKEHIRTYNTATGF